MFPSSASGTTAAQEAQGARPDRNRTVTGGGGSLGRTALCPPSPRLRWTLLRLSAFARQATGWPDARRRRRRVAEGGLSSLRSFISGAGAPPIPNLGSVHRTPVSNHQRGPLRGPFGDWRRGWDSNPRYPQGYNGFRDRPVRPLRHPSAPGRGPIRGPRTAPEGTGKAHPRQAAGRARPHARPPLTRRGYGL